MNKNNLSYGFTIVEILVVIGLILILSAILVSVLGSVSQRAAVSRDQSNLRQMSVAIGLYANEFGYYPGAGFSRVGRVRSNIVSSPSFDFSPRRAAIHLAEKLYAFGADPGLFESPLVGQEVHPGEHYQHNRLIFGFTNEGIFPVTIFSSVAEDKSKTWAIHTTDSFMQAPPSGPPTNSLPPFGNARNYLYLDGSIRRVNVEEP